MNGQRLFVQPSRRVNHVQGILRHQIGIPQRNAGGFADVDQTGRVLEDHPFQGLLHLGAVFREQILQRQRAAAIQIDDPPEKQRFFLRSPGGAEGNGGLHGQNPVKIHGRGITAPDGIQRAARVSAVIRHLFLPEQGQNGVGDFFLQILRQSGIRAFKGGIIHRQLLTASVFFLMAPKNADAVPAQFRDTFRRQCGRDDQQQAQGQPKGQSSFHESVPPYFSSAPPGRRKPWTGPHTALPRPSPAESNGKEAGDRPRL